MGRSKNIRGSKSPQEAINFYHYSLLYWPLTSSNGASLKATPHTLATTCKPCTFVDAVFLSQRHPGTKGKVASLKRANYCFCTLHSFSTHCSESLQPLKHRIQCYSVVLPWATAHISPFNYNEAFIYFASFMCALVMLYTSTVYMFRKCDVQIQL